MDQQQVDELVKQILSEYQKSGGDQRAFQQAVSKLTAGLDSQTMAALDAALKPQSGESPDDVVARLSKKYEVTEEQQQTPEQQFGSQVTQQMSEFLNFLNQPVDLNSPYAQNILRGTAFNTMREAQLAGVRGGLSGAATERAVANAAMGLEAQRQDRLMQALGMGSGRDLGLQNVDLSRQAQAEQRYQFDAGQAYKNYQEQQQQRMAMYALAAGLGGAAVGSAGGPAGIAAGYKAGAQIGGGLAGSTGPTWSAPARY